MGANAMFYGIGVGPGDPALMTVRARDVIGNVDVLAYPVNGSGESRARTIAASAIRGDVRELPIHVPMQVERGPARAAYDAAIRTIAEHLNGGRDVGYLCIGDPLFYGSFMYLAARLEQTHGLEIIPGVTSLSACAARTHMPLGGRNDVLSVIPATLDEAGLKAALAGPDMAVIIKLGRHFEKVRGVLASLGLTDKAVVVEGATGADERLTPLAGIEPGEQPYFSAILVRRSELS